MNATKSKHPEIDDWKAAYEQVCDAHNGIADFRGKLLALLPIASGAGIFLVLSKDLDAQVMPHLFAVGIFGATVTLGLFVYELVGIHRCQTLRKCGHVLEERLLPSERIGRFTPYPEKTYPLVKVPVASLIIYPTVIGAWIYVASIGLGSRPFDSEPITLALRNSGLVALSFIVIATMIRRSQKRRLETYYAEHEGRQGNDPTSNQVRTDR